MLDLILSATLLTKIALLIVIVVLFDYYDKFLYSLNLTILGLLSIELFLLLSFPFSNYLHFILLSVFLGFFISLLSYFLSFPLKTITNISISLLLILVSFKLIPLFFPEYNLGIGTQDLINNKSIYNNQFLAPIFLILSVCYALLFYYDYNSPLKIGLQLLSSDRNTDKYIHYKKPYLLILFTTRITIGVVLYIIITVHKGLITIDDFGFDYLFEIIAFLLLISTFKNYFKIRYNSIVWFLFLYFGVPALFVYVFEIIQRTEFLRDFSHNLVYAIIWIIILILTFLSTMRKKNKYV